MKVYRKCLPRGAVTRMSQIIQRQIQEFSQLIEEVKQFCPATVTTTSYKSLLILCVHTVHVVSIMRNN